jgi:hypothetical protein
LRAAWLQSSLLALLAINIGAYAFTGRASELLDALAWFVLLGTFSLAGLAPEFARSQRRPLLLLRSVAASVALWAALRFVGEGEWLDAINAWLWIAVVIALETELRVVRLRPLLRASTMLLYLGLLLVAVLWLAGGDWFEAYDALLWICAFVLVERGLGQPGSS